MSGKMFDKKDYPTEWALNPSNYRTMDNDQVDWAALAQEWIKMKETRVPPAPTPPSITENPSSSSSYGGGEAPMDMDLKDDGIPPAPPAPNISGPDNWNRWDQWSSNWNQTSIGLTNTNWDWNNVSPEVNETITRIPNNMMIPPPAPVISCSPAFVDHNALSPAVPLDSCSSFGYNAMTHPRPHYNKVPSGGFWNNEQHPHAQVTPTSPFLKESRQGITRIPQSSAPVGPTMDIMVSRNRDAKEKTPENDSLSTIDTIKRKQLPAWIREGLEKMEREKRKAIERERQAVLRKQELEACKKIKDQARAVLSPEKSKFDSDSEKELPEYECHDLKDDSADDVNKLQKPICDQSSPDVSRPRKTRFRDASSPEKVSSMAKPPNTDLNTNNSTTSSAPSAPINKEELLQNLMLHVRRSLTEILLEVTNDEINSICEEVWKNVHNRGQMSIAPPGNTAPVAQITRRLGLGIYSDSDSDSSDEHVVQNQSEKSIMPNRNDSDEELKETLRLRQQAFKKTEAEIEACLAAEEEENTKEQDQIAKNKANKTWKENCSRNDSLPDVIASRSISRGTPDHFYHEDESSSSESSLVKRKISYSSNNGKHSNTSSSSRKKNRRSSENARRYSSSRSRSRSKNDSSSRENSCESSSSKTRCVNRSTASADRTVKKDESRSENYKSNREFGKKSASFKSSQYSNRRSRSTSRSESRSRSRSRSKSRSRDRSNSTVGSKQKRSRSRSYSSFRRQHRQASRSQSRSRSRYKSRSRSKSRSRKTSKSEGARRRSRTRSRSTDRGSRRSRSNTRKSKSSHRQRHRGYERDRNSKKSTRHYVD